MSPILFSTCLGSESTCERKSMNNQKTNAADSNNAVTRCLQSIVASTAFQVFVLAVILMAAVVVGVETYPSMEQKYGGLLHTLDKIILWIFVVEAALKMAQHGRHFYRYFKDPWNVFDFTIVVVCFLPVNASYAAVMRLARIMRALRLMTALPQLQLIVGALIKSIPSMGYVGILLSLNFYVYAVMGVFLFGENDPKHFGNLQSSMVSLFRVVTLEDWTDIMYGVDVYPGLDDYQKTNHTGVTPQPDTIKSSVVGAVYFVSFVMFGTMIMLNLFIGVILNSMDEARSDREREHQKELRAAGKRTTVGDDIMEIDHRIDQLKHQLLALRMRLESGANGA